MHAFGHMKTPMAKGKKREKRKFCHEARATDTEELTQSPKDVLLASDLTQASKAPLGSYGRGNHLQGLCGDLFHLGKDEFRLGHLRCS